MPRPPLCPAVCLFIRPVAIKRLAQTVTPSNGSVVRQGSLENVPLMLVGNKCDETEARELTVKEGEEQAKKWQSHFMETSAKTNHNVKELFQVGRLITDTLDARSMRARCPPVARPLLAGANPFSPVVCFRCQGAAQPRQEPGHVPAAGLEEQGEPDHVGAGRHVGRENQRQMQRHVGRDGTTSITSANHAPYTVRFRSPRNACIVAREATV